MKVVKLYLLAIIICYIYSLYLSYSYIIYPKRSRAANPPPRFGCLVVLMLICFVELWFKFEKKELLFLQWRKLKQICTLKSTAAFEKDRVWSVVRLRFKRIHSVVCLFFCPARAGEKLSIAWSAEFDWRKLGTFSAVDVFRLVFHHHDCRSLTRRRHF